jgi:hypothetical protein
MLVSADDPICFHPCKAPLRTINCKQGRSGQCSPPFAFTSIEHLLSLINYCLSQSGVASKAPHIQNVVERIESHQVPQSVRALSQHLQHTYTMPSQRPIALQANAHH